MTKEQRTKTKEQRTMSKEQRIMKKTRKKPVFLSALCSLFSAHCSLLTVLCSLFIAACEGDPGFMQRIDNEVAWANAERLTVTMVYPQEWGSGADRFYDDVRTRESPRMGFSFTVQFDPVAEFGDAHWRAYRTTDLPDDFNWFISSKNIRTELLGLASKMLTSKEICFSEPVGNRSAVKIKIPDAVTIIPWSYMQPRVVRSNPPYTATYQNFERTPNRDITVTFAARVIPSTLKFEPGFIEITGNGKDITDEFSSPSYDNETHTMTILSRGNVDVGINIEVKIGTQILSAGDLMGMNEPVTFSWRTVLAEDDVKELKTFYDEEKKQIKVEWELQEDASPLLFLRYRINNDPIDLADIAGTSAVIENVYPPDHSGVREGRSITGVNSYSFFLDFEDNTKTIRIWNIPGMSASDANPITEINSPAGLAAIPHGAQGQYVLLRNIEIEEHTPIQNFTGNFYGNGHTITINSLGGAAMDSNPSDWGLFGAVSGNAIIRDLTVEYADTQTISNPTSGSFNNIRGTVITGSYVGGITGRVTGNTNILNCIVRGVNSFDTLTVNASSGSHTICLGGITGYFEGNGKIENCRAALSVKYEAKDAHTGSVYIGGIAGGTDAGGDANKLSINNGYTGGTAAQGPDVTLERLLINKVTITADVIANKDIRAGSISVGGAVGRSGEIIFNNFVSQPRNTMNEVEYINGTVSFYRTSSNGSGNDFGGIIGYARNTNIIESQFYGNIGTIDNAQVSSPTSLGGLIGHNRGATGVYFINNCTVRTNIEYNGITTKRIGGILGESYFSSGSSSIITNCFFERGNINVRGPGGNDIGGFIGMISLGTHIFNNCGAKEGTINVEQSIGSISVGGFVSTLRGNISNCFSNMDIITSSIGRTSVGGFMGYLYEGTISNCYASGTVRVIQNDYTDHNVNAGGLVGRIGGADRGANLGPYAGTIDNSYALGNVIGDKQSGEGRLHAGGLVGWNDNGDISNSFAAGQVIAQSASDEAYAGGLVGYSTRGTISNTATLGATVTVKNASERGIGRIYGFPETNVGSNNYARNDMRLELSNDYYTFSFPFWDGNSTAPSTYYRYPAASAIGLTTQHGENASLSTFHSQSFWLSGLDNLGGDITFHDSEDALITGVALGTPITVRYSGTENVTWQWYMNGRFISNTSGRSTHTPEPSYLNPGTGSYTVILYNSNYYPLTSASITVVANSGNPYLTGNLTISPKTNVIGSVLTADYSGNEAVAYQWLRDGLEIPGATTTSYTVDSPGRYTVRASSGTLTAITSQSLTFADKDLGFSSEHWDFSGLVREGFPRLRGVSGQ